MKAKHFGPINVHAQQWAHAQPHNDVRRVLAQGQSGLETLPGYAVRKLRLEFAIGENGEGPAEEAEPATEEDLVALVKETFDAREVDE